MPRPARQHCPSKRCIDTTCPNAPTPDPDTTLWKTPDQDDRLNDPAKPAAQPEACSAQATKE